ncbi:MAG TPA: DUF4097 family beta strand repeat-containing protein [Anaerolineae bacterium]|nr:DUF4097 family beta strand repeat-containing protein [Anaerolineae bacterium]
MNTYRFPLCLLFVWLLSMGLTACSVSTANATPSRGLSADAFGAQQAPVPMPGPVKIISELPGEIQVISYSDPEVAVDTISTGLNNADNTAALPASKVTLEPKDGGMSIQVLPGDPAPKSVLVHVRVPNGSSIVIDSPRIAANVTIIGAVKDVTVQIQQGDITVRGARGNISLRTEGGSINVDERDEQDHTLELHAKEGGITVFALRAKVVATTTNGPIRFIGTLVAASSVSNNISEFTVTDTGDISIALPDNAKFRYKAFGGSRVVTDVARDVESCGLASSHDYDFHRRMLAGGELGRVEVSSAITTTNQVQGTYGKGILYFDTNRKNITIFDPPNPPSRSGGPSGSGTVGDCGQLSNENLAVANIDFTVHADSGSIWIHQIKMK